MNNQKHTTIYDGTILTIEGWFEVYVKIQDSTEHIGSFKSKIKAKNAWVEGHKAYNHTDRKPEEMPFYIEQEVTQRIAVKHN